MMMWQLPLLLGALAGVGAWLIIRSLVPTNPDLGAALNRLDDTTPPTALTDTSSLYARLGLRARKRLGERIPLKLATSQDMALTGKEPHLLLGEKITLAVFFAALPPILGAALTLMGFHLPIAVPLVVSIALGGIGWIIPDLLVRSQASELREEFAGAASIYLDLLSIARISGAMPHEALRSAAAVPDTWPFARISRALASSEWDGRPPWDALEDLADEVGVPALADVADIMRLSGEAGATVFEALRGRAKSLRSAQLATEHAKANQATEHLTVPATLPVIIVVGMLIYPYILVIMG